MHRCLTTAPPRRRTLPAVHAIVAPRPSRAVRALLPLGAGHARPAMQERCLVGLLLVLLLCASDISLVDGAKKKKKKGPAKVNVRAELNTAETLELFVAIEERAGVAEVERKIDAGGDPTALFESSPSCERIKCQPLHVAAATSQPDVAALLVSKGAPADGLDTKKRTPLHVAAISETNGADLVIQKLVGLGASLEATNGAGVTPVRNAHGRHKLCVCDATQ
eukprot:SAG31_NODE_3439_length_4270_cov_5.065452_3_plen_222_part_00